MQRKLFLFIFSLFFFFSFSLPVQGKISPEEKEELLIKYEEIQKRLKYLRWYVNKFDLKDNLSADSYLISDILYEENLLEKNPTSAYPIASVTKLMSAVVTRENIDETKKITLTPSMLGHNRESPALYLGATVSGESLLRAMLIQSTNDASEALTYFLESGKFIKLMNEKKEDIGMEKSVFFDAHGLGRSCNTKLPENMASASDLFKLLKYIKENHPEILEITTEENFSLPGKCPDREGLCTFLNLNVAHGIKEFLGGKTGYIPVAKQTFAGLFEFNKKPYAVVLLYSENRVSDLQKICNWLREMPTLQ